MKTLVIGIMALFLATNISTQEIKKDTLTKEQTRLLKKQKKEAELKIQYDSISQILDSKQFVLEADFLDNLRGRRIYVTSTLNFIEVDTTRSVIQIGSVSGIGYNGVGGVTADGQITSWKLEKNEKKKTFYLEMSVLSNIGIYDIYMNINADGKADATLSGLRYGRLEFDGKIVPIEESIIFKGHTL